MKEEVLERAYRVGRRWSEARWPFRDGAISPHAVSEEMWRKVGEYCRASTLTSLGATSIFFYRATRCVVPGLKTSLYPHQVNSMCFMLRRERGGGGGVLADAPGLGKTVVVLCVMLRTKGLVGTGSDKSLKEIEADQRHKLIPGLRSSAGASRRASLRGGTLMVVPTTLLDHWSSEMKKWCGDLGWVFVEGRDRWGWNDRAPDVAIVSDARLASEFGRERDSVYCRGADRYRSPLTATSWLRIVVDEGHHQGAEATTNVTLMIRRMAAKRKWLLSGTPVSRSKKRRSNGEESAIFSNKIPIKQLGRLFYCVGVVEDEATWRSRVVENREDGANAASSRSSEVALTEYCKAGLVRHTAADLHVPTPIRIVTRLDMSDAEANSLNSFVAFILSNVLLTSMEVDDERSMRDGFAVSLLNAKNRRQAMDAIRNILLCCAGGGEMVPHAPPGVIDELAFLLREVHRAPAAKVNRVLEFVTLAAQGGNRTFPCDYCAIELSYLLVTPCCHLLCPECVRPWHKGCVACKAHFQDVTYFVSDDKCEHTVEVVPIGGESEDATIPTSGLAGAGYEVRCRHWHGWATRNDERARRCEKRHEGWKTKRMSGIDAFVWLQPGLELRWREAMLETQADDLALSLWRRQATRGGEGRRRSPSFLNADAASLSVIKKDDSLDQHSKANHIVQRLEAALEARNAPRVASSDDSRPVRCIVFAEERRVLDWIGHYLIVRFGEDSVMQFWGRFRNDELAKFDKGVAIGWRCGKCGYLNEDSSQKTCSRRFVRAFVDGDDDEAALTVAEERVQNYYPGRVFRVGEPVVVPDADGMWTSASVDVVKRCSGQKKGRPAEIRRLPENGVRVLLLHRDGRHGLSLPQTTHIFCVNTIWEKNCEDQVVARAARIGATHPVVVEQLLMKDTAEDDLYRLSRDDDDGGDDGERVTGVIKRLRLYKKQQQHSISNVVSPPPHPRKMLKI